MTHYFVVLSNSVRLFSRNRRHYNSTEEVKHLLHHFSNRNKLFRWYVSPGLLPNLLLSLVVINQVLVGGMLLREHTD